MSGFILTLAKEISRDYWPYFFKKMDFSFRYYLLTAYQCSLHVVHGMQESQQHK